MSTDLLKFPSGRSVGNCRNDAKRLARQENIPLHEALDRVAATNGVAQPWARAMTLVGDGVTGQRSSPDAITVDDIRAVMEKWPHLSHSGFEVSCRPNESYREVLAASRKQLLEAVDECNRAARFLKHIERRKTINLKAGSSYGLKHEVEYFCHSFPNAEYTNQYVANGSFICVALHLGFEVQPTHFGSPNVYFNISSRSPVFEWRRLKDRANGLYYYPKDVERLAELEVDLGLKSA
ncbi:hypothetical protein [Undibacterium aquatile]|uniref:Uncharacterized protein n=1 Tax=Undibacterium aquatile TaxID=1537398 RepID=A0ABR6XCJ7_9BURK|nr:hypothetical protein [Undibacterium aquatile]MBC3810091.1 hypothetical protein [Undibacterium aquatile]